MAAVTKCAAGLLTRRMRLVAALDGEGCKGLERCKLETKWLRLRTQNPRLLQSDPEKEKTFVGPVGPRLTIDEK